MKSKTLGYITLFAIMGLVAIPAAQAKKADDVDVVTACKTDCPEAKKNAEAHECVEKKAKIRPSFKKTKCWEINEEYEQLVQAAPAKSK